ncbi:MAG: endonuclease III domain-containing protein [Candidatus Cloacimonadota bacterium]|nr:MAG: endonuclease III domain-containing protein [Candidatus Cloacimonadota bacterium]
MDINLIDIYNKLLEHYGYQKWWPGETQDEIIIGAILTQSVNWKNVEKAIQNLKRERLCTLKEIHKTPLETIAPLIRPTIYFNRKAEKLKNFAKFIYTEFDGDLDRMFSRDPAELRKKLLVVKGIGEETADSILLYAGNLPFFVIDAYTKRVFSRMGFIEEDSSYAEMQQFFINNLPLDVTLYNDFHAQIVMLAKTYCKKRNPDCGRCPIAIYCQKQYS